MVAEKWELKGKQENYIEYEAIASWTPGVYVVSQSIPESFVAF
jgi:hypothetical protein